MTIFHYDAWQYSICIPYTLFSVYYYSYVSYVSIIQYMYSAYMTVTQIMMYNVWFVDELQWGIHQGLEKEDSDDSNPLNPGNFKKVKLIPDGAVSQ